MYRLQKYAKDCSGHFDDLPHVEDPFRLRRSVLPIALLRVQLGNPRTLTRRRHAPAVAAGFEDILRQLQCQRLKIRFADRLSFSVVPFAVVLWWCGWVGEGGSEGGR